MICHNALWVYLSLSIYIYICIERDIYIYIHIFLCLLRPLQQFHAWRVGRAWAPGVGGFQIGPSWICIYIYIYRERDVYVCIEIYTYIHMYMYVCMYLCMYIYIYMHVYIIDILYIYIYMYRERGLLAEYGWKPHRDLLAQEKAYRGPQLTDICVKHRGVRFHRIRIF